MSGINRFGAYVPWRRLQKSVVYEANAWFASGLKGLAKGERAVGNWDEDVVTMAVEASRDCLGDLDRSSVDALLMASTSYPYADRQNSGIVKEALVLRDAISALDIGSSQKAGTSALIQGFHAAAAGMSTLVVGSEMRRARPASEDEMVNGDAAAALLLGPDNGIAKFLGSYSETVDFVDRFRPSDAEFDSGWELRWVREEGFQKLGGDALKRSLEHFDLDATDVGCLIVGITSKGIGAALAKKAGISPDVVHTDLQGELGHAGSAQPLVQLAHALESAKPGSHILVLGFGQGVDVLHLQATDAIGSVVPDRGVSGWLGHRVEEGNYLKYLAFAGHLGLELGKRAEFDQKPVPTALHRNRKAVMGLVGARCTRTGTIQFPGSDIGVNPNNATIGTQVDYPLADRTARILTYTADSLTYTPDPPNYYGMVDFDGGGRMLAEFTDVDPEKVEVGAPVRMMFRIKARDPHSGFSKYFWKAVPAAGSE